MDNLKSYQDLRVWQVGMAIAKGCYLLTRQFPREEMFAMTSQLRRASASVPANIAEGYGRDRRGDFLNFLRIAQGSLKEVETHLLLSISVELCSDQDANPILALCAEEGRMLTALIRSVEERHVKEVCEFYVVGEEVRS